MTDNVMDLVVECPICKADKTKISLYWHRFVLCSICKTIWDVTTGKFVLEYYSSGQYREDMRQRYIKNFNMTSEGVDEAEVSIGENRANYLQTFVHSLLPVVSSHLDIGCSAGILLRKMKAGYQVGVDPDPVYGHATFATIDEVPDHKFQLVTLIQTLEHIADPITLLKKCVGHLEDDGLFVIEVPNRVSYEAAFQEPHIFAWDVESLKNTVQLVGLEPKQAIIHPMPFDNPLPRNILMFCKKKAQVDGNK